MDIQITAIISIVISIMSFIFTVLTKTSDSFNAKAKKYDDTIEDLYMKMLDIYTSKNRDEKIREFLDTVFSKGINTTLFLNEHGLFLLLKEDYLDNKVEFDEIRSQFDSFARSIEELYWKRYEIVQYKVVQSDNWKEAFIKELLIKLFNFVSNIKKSISYLFWISIFTLFSGIGFTINKYLELNSRIMEYTFIIFFIIFILSFLFTMLLFFIERFLLKKIQKNYVSIKGSTFIRNKTESIFERLMKKNSI